MDAQALKALRLVNGFTQRRLAELLKVSPETVRAWEAGRNPIPESIQFTLLGRLAKQSADERMGNLVATEGEIMESLTLKKRTELARGRQFIAWFNAQHGTDFGEPDAQESPDLLFRDGKRLLKAEVTYAYYDERDAMLMWEMARGKIKGPVLHGGMVNPDVALRDGILYSIAQKLRGDYGKDCVLLVGVSPAITRLSEIQEMFSDRLADEYVEHSLNGRPCPFKAIYIVGHFPLPEHYQTWQLWPSQKRGAATKRKGGK